MGIYIYGKQLDVILGCAENWGYRLSNGSFIDEPCVKIQWILQFSHEFSVKTTPKRRQSYDHLTTPTDPDSWSPMFVLVAHFGDVRHYAGVYLHPTETG